MKPDILFCILLMISPGIQAGQSHQHMSPYAGQEDREIKSLSDDDLIELRRGGGWGLAKAAELNGVPGPAHLLELKNEISLSSNQITAITEVFEEMQGQAIRQGERLIALERELETNFRQRTITKEVLRSLLDQIGTVRAELRYIHLSAHLKTDYYLTPEQVKEYNRLRGYTTANPCDHVPTGHDPDLWRKHNGCG